MDKDILFDNIYVGHSIEDADKFAQETFHVKHPIEELLELESRPKDEDKPIKSPSDLVFMDDPVLYVKEKLDLFFTIAKTNPIEAVKFVPEAAGGLAAVVIAALTILISLISMGTSSPAPQVKKAAAGAKSAAVNAKDKAVDAVASGAEQAKEQVNKRATRSTT
jgi:calnexin